jgi:hypothetical protein
MTFSVEKLPDTLLVLIDIDDPLTYDKEFQRMAKYCPYVCGGSEMSPRNRKVVRERKVNPDPLFANKFILEVFVDKFGDFATMFLANPLTQRSLIFRKLHWSGPDITDIPDSVLKEMEQDGVDPEEYLIEEQDLTHIYELTSGPALMLHDGEGEDGWESFEVDDSGEIVDLRSEEDKMKSAEGDDEDDAFVVLTNKTVH